jgi:pimeloyl-ACP methyl ester carboxylesterase
MVALLDHFGLERAVLIGHSLGAYIVARVAAEHPDRVAAALLVDGGLTVPVADDVDPQRFLDAFLGPALARLKMTFASRAEYQQWWRRHPAFVGGDVDAEDLAAFADHDLIGDEPQLHSSVSERAVRGDAGDLFEMGEPAHRLTVPATLMCASRGLLDEPNPMQPMALVREWVDEAPEHRSGVPVADVNHYTITLGRTGAAAVAAAVLGALELAAAQDQV